MILNYKNKAVTGSGPKTYVEMPSKPKINDVELLGNQTTEDLKISWYGTQAQYDALIAAGDYNPNTIYVINDGDELVTTSNYLDLDNKPKINGIQLTGNKTSGDLKMYTSAEIDALLASMRSIKQVSVLPAAPVKNTLYYVGPVDSEGTLYDVYLIDSGENKIYLGTTDNTKYAGNVAIEVDSSNKISLKYDDETIKVNSSNEVYAEDMKGATTSAKGTHGLVPAPDKIDTADEHEKVLENDGTWSADFVKATGDEMTGDLEMKSSAGIKTNTGNIEMNGGALKLLNGSYLVIDGSKASGSQTIRNNVDNSSMVVEGGSAWSNGADLQLCGKDVASPNTGSFKLLANNGTTNVALMGKPDGTLQWNDSNVETRKTMRYKDITSQCTCVSLSHGDCHVYTNDNGIIVQLASATFSCGAANTQFTLMTIPRSALTDSTASVMYTVTPLCAYGGAGYSYTGRAWVAAGSSGNITVTGFSPTESMYYVDVQFVIPFAQ